VPAALAFALTPAFALVVLCVTAVSICLALATLLTFGPAPRNARRAASPTTILIEIDGRVAPPRRRILDDESCRPLGRHAAAAHAATPRVAVAWVAPAPPPARTAPAIAATSPEDTPPEQPASELHDPPAADPARERTHDEPAPPAAAVTHTPPARPATVALAPPAPPAAKATQSTPAPPAARMRHNAPARPAARTAPAPPARRTAQTAPPLPDRPETSATPPAPAPLPDPPPPEPPRVPTGVVTIVGRMEAPGPGGTAISKTRSVQLVDMETWATWRGVVDDQGGFAFGNLEPGGRYCIVGWLQARTIRDVRHDGQKPVADMVQTRYSWHQALYASEAGTWSLRLDEYNADAQFRADLVPADETLTSSPHERWRRAELMPVAGPG